MLPETNATPFAPVSIWPRPVKPILNVGPEVSVKVSTEEMVKAALTHGLAVYYGLESLQALDVMSAA